MRKWRQYGVIFFLIVRLVTELSNHTRYPYLIKSDEMKKMKRYVVNSVISGVIGWILFGLFMQIIGMGTNRANVFTPDQLMNLGTHLFFSIVLAIVFKLRTEKQVAPKAAVR